MTTQVGVAMEFGPVHITTMAVRIKPRMLVIGQEVHLAILNAIMV